MCHHLVAAVAAGREHDRRAKAGDELAEGRRPGEGGKGRQPIVLDDVGDGAATAELRRRFARVGADRHGVQRLAGRGSELPGKGQRLERQPFRATVYVLDEGKDHRLTTPIRVSSSTTAGAASGPVPMTSTVLSVPTGNRSRSLIGPPRRAAGVIWMISFFFARSRPGTDG